MEDKELLAWFLEHSNDGSLTELIQFKKFNFKGFTKINTSKARDFAIAEAEYLNGNFKITTNDFL